MAVQTGEGTTDIIYGTHSIPGGPYTYGGYLARPDGEGEWPTVLVLGPNDRPTSAVKNICRVLARHGVAALAPDLDEGGANHARITSAVAAFIANPVGHWSNAEFGYGVLAFEGGASMAAQLTSRDGRVLAFACVGSDLDEDAVGHLADSDVSAMFIGSRGDGQVDIDAALATRDRIPRTTYVVYPDGGTGFWNDDADGFDEQRYEDTLERLIAFFDAQLPPRV